MSAVEKNQGEKRRRRNGYSPKDTVDIRDFIENDVIVEIPASGPVRLLFIADLHLFDPDTSKEYVDEVFDELGKPNTYAILLGDIIQGFNPSKAGMAAGVPRLDEQMLTAEEKLKIYADQGKLIAAVGGTDSHEGWGDKEMTFDVTYFMLRHLKGADGEPLPIMNNGGYVTLKFPNGGEHRIRVFHNPGGGGSVKNMAGAQRARAMEVSIDHPDCPDEVMGGHNHSRAIITTEVWVNPITGEVVTQILGAGGTAQGIEPENPNIFLTAKAVAPSLAGLPATILNPKDDGGVDIRAVWGMENSGELLWAMRLWDAIESRGMGKEVEEMIRKSISPTESIFEDSLSRQVVRTSEVNETFMYSRAYEVIRWKINTVLPVGLTYVSGLREGSSTSDEAGVTRIMAESIINPELFVMNMRRMVDKGLSSRMDRSHYLNRMINLIEPAGKEGKILALLLDEGLREKRWKQDLGDPESETSEFSPGIMTGDVIQNRIPGLPLAVNNTFVIIDVGGVEYRIRMRDKLGQNGSTENPFNGLVAQKRKGRMRIDVMVGGHMPRVGVSQSVDGIVVAPGGFAKWAEMGEANEEEMPKGGQSVILYPGQKRMYGCATFEESVDTQKAVFYAEGLKYLPTEDATRLRRMGRRNR